MDASSLPPGLQAVIFDFDGTLADSYAAIAASVNHVRAAHALPPLNEAEVKRHVGRGPDYLLEMTVGVGNMAANLALYRAHHPSVMRSLTHLLPGAAEALAGLHSSGRRCGVCSNKLREFTLELLKTLQIAPYIDAVVGPEDAPHPKPAPDMLLIALQRLVMPASAALYIGDMTVDIQTARAAGVRVWVVQTGSDTRQALELAKPDLLLGDLTELARMVSRT
jgi:2-phosphoglycolate phosphatase